MNASRVGAPLARDAVVHRRRCLRVQVTETQIRVSLQSNGSPWRPGMGSQFKSRSQKFTLRHLPAGGAGVASEALQVVRWNCIISPHATKCDQPNP